MRTFERFPAGRFFSGERRVALRTLPFGARVRSARFVLSPVANNGGIGIAQELLEFGTGDGPATASDDPDRPVGAFKTRETAANLRWVEIAFDGRRIADRVNAVDVSSPNLGGASLQVDIGGVFVRLNEAGAILAGDDDPFVLPNPFPASGAALPAVMASRFRITAAAPNTSVNLDRVTVRAIASNVRLWIGSTANAFVRPGDLLSEAETTDLAEVVQLALDEADDTGTGYAEIPVVLTIDGTARISIGAELEYEAVADLLGSELPEANLDYAFDGSPTAAGNLLQIRVPAGMQVAADGTSVDLVGSFEGSEIVRGPLVERVSPGSVALPAGSAVAQPFTLAVDADVDALDVLAATVERRSRLQLDLRRDLDGKPSAESTLPAPVTLEITDARHATRAWASARLGRAVQLVAGTRWWLVTQCLEGSAVLFAGEAETADPVPPQSSTNGGLSWRAAEIAGALAKPEQHFRLRRQSPAFKVPVTAEVGRDDAAELIALDAFQPLGRVDFTLDGTRIAGAANQVITAERAGACPRGELLVNGDFADRDQAGHLYSPAGWSTSGGRPVVVRLPSAVRPDATALVVVLAGDGPRSLSQVLTASGGCSYELTVAGFAIGPDARIEAIWRRGDCGVARVDTLIPVSLMIIDVGFDSLNSVSVPELSVAIMPSNRLRITAPDDATGLEIRLLASDETRFVIDGVSLEGSPSGLLNHDFLEIKEFVEAVPGDPVPDIPGWTIEPSDARLLTDLELSVENGVILFANKDAANRTLTLNQTLAALAGAPIDLTVRATATVGTGGAAPSAGILWQDRDGNPLGPELGAVIGDDTGGVVRLTAEARAGATAFTVSLDLPPQAALIVEDIVLEHDVGTTVPLTFLAEAPGRLTIRDFSIAFEPAPQPAPVTPEGGLCQPTPADQAPGDDCEQDPCCTCGTPTPSAEIVPPRLSTAPAATAVSFSARTRLVSRRIAATRLRDDALDQRLAIVPRRFLTRAEPLTAVAEIGPARAEALAGIGIRTPRMLALADPAELSRTLDFAPSLSERLVENARDLLAAAASDRTMRRGRPG